MEFNLRHRAEIVSLAITSSESKDSQPIIDFFENYIASNSYLVCMACGKSVDNEKCCEKQTIMRVLLGRVTLEKKEESPDGAEGN